MKNSNSSTKNNILQKHPQSFDEMDGCSPSANANLNRHFSRSWEQNAWMDAICHYTFNSTLWWLEELAEPNLRIPVDEIWVVFGDVTFFTW
jgi:hypothetical protein